MIKAIDATSRRLFHAGLIATAALLPADLMTEGFLGVEALVLALMAQRAIVFILLNAANFPAVTALMSSSLPFALPVATGALTAAWALHPGIAFSFVLMLAVVAGRGWVVGRFTDARGLRLFELTTLVVTGLVVLFGYFQFIGDVLGLSPDLTFLIERYRSGTTFAFPRVHSVALEPLYLANYLLLPIGLLLFRLKRRPEVWLVVFLAFVLALFFSTVSRGAVAGLILGAGLLAFSWRKDAQFLKFAGAGLVAGVLLVVLMMQLPGIVERRGGSDATFTEHLTDLGDASALSRFEIWPTAFQAFRDDPLTGVGPDNSRAILHPEKFAEGESYAALQPINNDYVTILTEMGLLGVAAFLPLVLLMLGRLWGLIRKGFDHPAGPYLFTLVGTAVQANTFGVLPLMRTWVVIGLVFAGFKIAGRGKT